MPVNVPSSNSRSSASAIDADSTNAAVDAAQSELDRITQWEKPSFAGGGRQQLQRDPSYRKGK